MYYNPYDHSEFTCQPYPDHHDQRAPISVNLFPFPGGGFPGGGGFPFPGGGSPGGGGGFPFPGGGSPGNGGGFPFPGGGSPGNGGGFPFPGGGSPGGGGGFPGGGGGQGGGAPQSPPPQFTPQKPSKPQDGFTTYLVDPNVIQPCLYRYTYVWLTNGSSFWFYPTVIGQNSVGGYYWNQNFYRWVYYALDTKYIDVVSCI